MDKLIQEAKEAGVGILWLAEKGWSEMPRDGENYQVSPKLSLPLFDMEDQHPRGATVLTEFIGDFIIPPAASFMLDLEKRAVSWDNIYLAYNCPFEYDDPEWSGHTAIIRDGKLNICYRDGLHEFVREAISHHEKQITRLSMYLPGPAAKR